MPVFWLVFFITKFLLMTLIIKSKKFKEDDSATIQQLERQIILLKKELQKLDSEIKTAKAIKQDIDNFIADAYKKKDAQCEELVKRYQFREKEANGMIKEYESLILHFKSEKFEFEKWKGAETTRINQIANSTETLNQSALERKAKNEFEGEKISQDRRALEKTHNELHGTLAESKKLIEENLYKSEKIVDLQKALEGKEYLLINDRKALEIRACEIENMIRDNESKIADLIKVKYDIEDKEKKILIEKAEIEKLSAQIKADKEDIFMIGKKNNIESFRLKEFEKVLRNREARIIEKENLVNQKIGE